MHAHRRLLSLLLVPVLALAACSDGDDVSAAAERPTVVVTTSVLGDVVANIVGDAADVVTIIPPGADPHEYQLSAQQVDAMREADALVANGAGFEAALVDVIESAEEDGVPTFEAISAVETLDFGDAGHDDEDEHGHDDEHAGEDEHGHEDEPSDDHGHAHEGVDPHFFTDPVRMATAVEAIAGFLGEALQGVDAAALDARADEYAAELRALDAEVEAILASVPEERRVLVTNHEVFGYFADRYGFEVVGTVIPAGSTAEAASAGDLAELAETIEAEGVPAIFVDESAAADLAGTVADEVGDVEVVGLYTESLGDEGSEGGTYIDMVRTNAERIAAALA